MEEATSLNEILLVSSPSGTGRATALSRIKKHLGDGRVKIVDLEREFLEPLILRRLDDGHPTLKSFQIPRRGTPQETLQVILRLLPRDVLALHWRDAIDDAVKQLVAAPEPLRILSLHLTYYRSLNFEIYSPVSYEPLFRQGRISRVVTLVDDVSDMYVRLTRPKSVFDIGRLVRQEYQRIQDDGLQAPGTPDLQYTLALGQVLRVLLSLLTWRQNEILAAETLAAQAGCLHRLLAVKHPVAVGADVLQGSDLTGALEVYLSHPISRPRKERNKPGATSWPAFTEAFHDFILACSKARLNDRRLTLLMPTAIDEYRIRKHPTKDILVPELGPRWPLLQADAEALLYDLPVQYPEYEQYESAEIAKIFDPPIDVSGKRPLPRAAGTTVWSALSEDVLFEVSGLLKGLTLAVRQQMAQRDFLLVRQCPGILLYRPLHGEQRFSGGVEAELKYWWDLLACDILRDRRVRRALFVHTSADTAGIDADVDSLSIGREVLAEARNALGSSYDPRLDDRFLKADYTDRDWFAVLVVDPGGPLSDGNVDPGQDHDLRASREQLAQCATRCLEQQRLGKRSSATISGLGAENVTVIVDDEFETALSMPRAERSSFWARKAVEQVIPAFIR